MSRNSIDSGGTYSFAANDVTFSGCSSSGSVKKLDLIPYQFSFGEDSVCISLKTKKAKREIIKLNGPFAASRKVSNIKDHDKRVEICYDEHSTSRSSLSYTECEDKGHAPFKLKKSHLHFSRLIKHVQKRDIFQTTYDVVVNVWNNPFPCHSFILVSHSSYFAKRLKNLKEKRNCKAARCTCTSKIAHLALNCAEVTCQIFSILHHWLYTGQLLLTENLVLPIWECAKFLQMKNAVRKCKLFLHRFLTPSNAMKAWEAAVESQKDDLRILVGEYLASNFLQITHCGTFLEYNLPQVVRLLSDDHIQISSEKDVLTAALIWLSQSWPERCKEAERIISCIRFNNMKPNEFLECINKNKQCEAVQNIHRLFPIIRKCFENENEMIINKR